MSTKIFNGHRVDLSRHDGSVFAANAAIRDAVTAAYQDAHLRLVVGLATVAADRYRHDGQVPPEMDGHADADRVNGTLVGDPRLRSPLLWAEDVIDAKMKQIEHTGLRNPLYDLSCSVCYLPDPDDARHVYLLLYAERDSYTAALRAVDGVEPYPYWNNSDRPAELTDTEWDTRRRTWDRVLGDRVPAQVGLTWEMVTGPYRGFHALWAEPDAIAAHIPDRATRARMLARQLPLPLTDQETTDAETGGHLDPARALQIRRAQVDALLPTLEAGLVDLDATALRQLPHDASHDPAP